ncbi:TAXI family TRAP transporter solute-binding subunit [Halalkalicoccus ordinarius]|uniref:TAXI family TRAP transporter solute-binding subunit n=1 Tax=Halalkalicoccus ordinarius TaxID=3116651 RepID=UPI00300ECA66
MDDERSHGGRVRSDRRAVLRTLGAAGLAGLAGCTDSIPGGESGESGSRSQNLIWATTATAETYYELSQEFEELIEEGTDYSLDLRTVDGETDEAASVDLLRSLDGADLDFATVRNDLAYFGRTGTGLEAFEEEPAENLRGVATLYPEGIHVLTRADAGIESLEDLEGRTIDTGAVDSATRVNALRILENVGLSEGDFSERNEGFTRTARPNGVVRGDAARGIGFAQTDGDPLADVDAAFVIGDWPIEAVEERLVAGDVNLLSLDEESRGAITDGTEWLTPDVIPADAYDGLEEDVDVVSVRAMIATHQGTDDEVVGNVTTTIFENADRIETKGSFISSETAMEGMSLEMDAAAERSLQETDGEAEEANETGDGSEGSGDAEDGNESTGDAGDGGTESGGDGGTDDGSEDGTDGTDGTESGETDDTGSGGTDGDAGGGDAEDSGDSDDSGNGDGADAGDTGTEETDAASDGGGEDAEATGGNESA